MLGPVDGALVVSVPRSTRSAGSGASGIAVPAWRRHCGMSVSATVIGKTRPLPVKIPTTLPPGPTTGPPRLPGRISTRKASCVSLRRTPTAGVAVRRLTTLALASNTTGSSTWRAVGSPNASGVPSLLARTIAMPRPASMPTRRTAWEPPVLSASRRLALPLTTLAAVRKSPCGSMRNAVANDWSLTTVITPSRSRSSSSGSSTAEGGAALNHWPAFGSRTAMPTTTREMTRATSAWSSRLLGMRLTVIQRRTAALSWTRPVTDIFITMRLRNTETGLVQPLEPAYSPVRVYVCGITPYDTTHLGHAFTFATFDVLVRALRAAGHGVRYVQNVTDVDDDIIRRARELGTTWDRLAATETALYEADMAALNVRPPDVFPRASQTIPKIINLVRRLEAQGHAYQREGNVYFRVGRVTDYGRLGRPDPD